MSDEGQRHLFDLQRIDLRIHETQQRIGEFAPRLEEVDAPFLAVEAEAEALKKRLQELKLDERRLTSSSEERRSRLDRLQERLNAVRNLREEAAVHAEADLVRRALEADEQEAFGVMDLVQKAEERLQELEAETAEARSSIEPKRKELLTAKANEEKLLADLEAERDTCSSNVEPAYLSLYNRIKTGGRAIAVAPMTEDGACGVCFNVIPLQLQNEVRHGQTLMRCEACGVILARPSDVPEGNGAVLTEGPALVDEAAEAPEIEGGAEVAAESEMAEPAAETE